MTKTKVRRLLAFTLAVLMLFQFDGGLGALAVTQDITLENQYVNGSKTYNTTSVSMHVGDTGRLVANYVEPTTQDTSSSQTDSESQDNPTESTATTATTTETTSEDASETSSEDVSDTMENTIALRAASYYSWYDDDEVTDLHLSYYKYESDDAALLAVGASDGSYTAKAPGKVTVEITGYNAANQILYYAEVNVTITVDMTNVTLQKSSLQGYLFANSYYGYDSLTMNIAINSDVVLDSDTMQSLSYSCKSSKKKVVSYVDMEIRDNVMQLSVSPNKAGTTTLTIKIEGKTFKVKLKLTEVKISETSCLISKSGSKKLKISGYSGSVKWSSTRSSVATVSSNGTVKGKAYGNTVIVAKIGDAKVGCAVSVIPASLIKVCNRGRYMGTNWKYSQPLRTKNGYYDCSSLVWKAYKPYTGITFGSAGYPGTTVTESAWCKAKGRVLKGGFSYAKLQNMKINPGDIFFRSNSKKKAYSTTYHVEMFIGYECVGFDSDGKPVVASKWAARENGYDPYNGYIWARPMKY